MCMSSRRGSLSIYLSICLEEWKRGRERERERLGRVLDGAGGEGGHGAGSVGGWGELSVEGFVIEEGIHRICISHEWSSSKQCTTKTSKIKQTNVSLNTIP